MKSEGGTLMEKTATRKTCAALFAAVLLSACSGGTDDTPPAALNPAPPIRKAFIDRMLSFDAALQGVRVESGHFPEGQGVLVVREAGISNFPSEDPWGGEIRYSGSGSGYEISSAGPDKAWGTKDDVRIRDGRPVD